MAAVAKLARTAKSTDELRVEYLGSEGSIISVDNEVALQEAYILHENQLLVFGVREVQRGAQAAL
jgi:hypothetical protein